MAMSYFDIAESVLLCGCAALATQTDWEGECCVVPGMPAFDDCCQQGGQAWARIIRSFPSTTFPRPDETTDQEDCSVLWAVELEVGHIRCVCFDMCKCEVKQENARLVLGDAEAFLQGIACCFEGGSCSGLDYRILGQEMIGPQGSCAGSKVRLAVRHAICCP